MPKPRAVRLEHLARAGFAARGAVYALIGALALAAAIGAGGDVGGGKSAMRALLDQPFGAALLGAVGLGLAFFALWRIVEGALDADGHGTSPKGLGTRALHVLSGLVNGGLAISAINLALGIGGGGGDDDATQDWTAWLLSQPLGRWLVAAVGLGVIGGGLFHLWKGFRGDVLKRLSVPSDKAGMARWTGRIGYAARGVTFALIGGFLVIAAIRSSASEAKGLGGALQALEEQPYGWALLAATALGLFAFGAFGVVQARWRRIDAPDLVDARAAVNDLARRA